MIYKASDFGIVPGRDCAPAFQRFFDKVKGPGVLELEPGIYDLYPDRAVVKEFYISNTTGADPRYKMKTIGLYLEDCHDLTIRGFGAVLRMHGKMTPIAAVSCTGLKLEGFAIDIAVPTGVDLTVVDASDRAITVSVPQANPFEICGRSVRWLSDRSPYSGELYWTGTDRMTYSQSVWPETGICYREHCPLFDEVVRVTKVEGAAEQQELMEQAGQRQGFAEQPLMPEQPLNGIRFEYEKAPAVKVGTRYQIRYTAREQVGGFFWMCRGVLLRELEVRYLHGFGLQFQTCENVTVEGCRFQAPAGSGRTTAAAADFLQATSCKGAVVIRNCLFDGPHDDPINVHGMFLQVTERLSARRVRLHFMHNESAGYPNYFPGDEVGFVSKKNMLTLFTARVEAVEGPDGRGGGAYGLEDAVVALDRELPEWIRENEFVAENRTLRPSLLVKGCTFREIPTRGILVTTGMPVVIRGNRFESMGASGVSISDDANFWYESGAVGDVLIEDNEFLEIGALEPHIPVILVEPTAYEEGRPVHGRITVRRNRFLLQDQEAVRAVSVAELVMEDNEEI